MQALAVSWNDDLARHRRALRRPFLPPRSRVVAHRRHLPDLPPLVRRQLRRRRRRPSGHHRAPRRPRGPGRGRALAQPVPEVAAEGCRVRRGRLLRRRPAVRHALRLRRRCWPRPTAAASGSSSTSCPITPPTSTSGSRPPSPPAPAVASARATSSATARVRTASCRRTTGSPSSADRRGRAWSRPTAHPVSGTCTCSTPPSPTSTGPTRRCARSSAASCASGSTVGSTGSASTSPTVW